MPIDVQLPVQEPRDFTVPHSISATLGASDSTTQLVWNSPNVLLGEAGSSRLFGNKQPYYIRYLSLTLVNNRGVLSLSVRPDTTSTASMTGLGFRTAMTVEISAGNLKLTTSNQDFSASPIQDVTTFTYTQNDVRLPPQLNEGFDYSNFMSLYNALSSEDKAATQIRIYTDEVFSRSLVPANHPRSTFGLLGASEHASVLNWGFRASRDNKHAFSSSPLWYGSPGGYYIRTNTEASRGSRELLNSSIEIFSAASGGSPLDPTNFIVHIGTINVIFTAGNLELRTSYPLSNRLGTSVIYQNLPFQYFQDGSEVETPPNFSNFMTLYNALSDEDKATTRLTLIVNYPVSALANVRTILPPPPPVKNVEYITFQVRSA